MNHPDIQVSSSSISCPHCGHELPAEASFCPYCEKGLKPDTEIKRPKNRRKFFLTVVLFLLFVSVGSALIYRHHRPVQYTGGAEIVYPLNGGDCRIFLSFNGNAGISGDAMPSMEDSQIPGSYAAILSRLFVRQDGNPNVQKAFLEQVESCSVSAAPRDNAYAMDVNGPDLLSGEEPDAAWIASVSYSPENGTNDILWDIRMKNGDTIHLQQSVTCHALPVLEYHYEDTPLETIGQIEDILHRTMESDTPDAVLILYLPPVMFDGKLTLDERTVQLYGTTDGDSRTTFTDTLTVNTRIPGIAEINGITFAGDGGTGLLAHEGVWLENCVFRGWDVGADAQNGSWIMMENCSFEKNRVGFRFNSHQASCSSDEYFSLSFSENETGIQIQNIPGDTPIHFTDCTFTDNKTDAEDPEGFISYD